MAQASVVAGIALHGGGHAPGAFSAFHWSYLAASVLLVGGVGGALLWYYDHQRGESPDPSNRRDGGSAR